MPPRRALVRLREPLSFVRQFSFLLSGVAITRLGICEGNVSRSEQAPILLDTCKVTTISRYVHLTR